MNDDRKFIRQEIGRIGFAKTTEERIAIEESLENYMVDKLARLQAAEAELADLREVFTNPTRLSAEWSGESVEVAYEAPIIKAIAASMAEWYKENGGPNYVEMQMTVPDSGMGELVLTIQKKEGKTPHELRVDAEKQLAATKRLLAAAQEANGV